MNNIREGYKITEVREIPSEWEVKKLKDIASICYGKSQKEVEVDNGKYKILGTGGIIGYTNDFLWNEPSVLIGRKGTIDKPQYIEEPFWTVDTLFYTKLSDNYIAKWLYYYLDNIDLKKYNEATGVPSLSVANLNTISIATPPHDEQEKIASIFSTIDEQIDNVYGLIEKNKELKKGLMQQLLTKGIGHTKFKKTEIGEIPEEWRVTTLGNISRNKGEYGIGASASEFIEGNARYLRITDIGDECNLLFNDIKGLNDSEYEKYLLSIGDIVFARTGNTTGKAYVYDENHGELVYAGFLIKFSINSDICKTNFIKYVIQTKRYWDWVAVMSTRSGQPGINSNEYSTFLVQVPSIEEQEKIALILSEVDEKIEIYENKKEKLEELKKGLMQQLLTGKIRVI